MISIAVLLVCALNFVYLDYWVNKVEWDCQSCADKHVPKTTPQPHGLAQAILLLWFLGSLFWMGWGITTNPYRQGKGVWIQPGDDSGFFVLGLVAFCIVSTAYFTFKVGRISGIVEFRNKEIRLRGGNVLT